MLHDLRIRMGTFYSKRRARGIFLSACTLILVLCIWGDLQAMRGEENSETPPQSTPESIGELDAAWGKESYHVVAKYSGPPLKSEVEVVVLQQNRFGGEQALMLYEGDKSPSILYVTDREKDSQEEMLVAEQRVDAWLGIMEKQFRSEIDSCGSDSLSFARFVVFARSHWGLLGWHYHHTLLEPSAIDGIMARVEQFGSSTRAALMRLAQKPRVEFYPDLSSTECSLDFFVFVSPAKIERWTALVPFFPGRVERVGLGVVP